MKKKVFVHWTEGHTSVETPDDAININMYDYSQPTGTGSLFSRVQQVPLDAKTARFYQEAERAAYLAEIGNTSASQEHSCVLPVYCQTSATNKPEELVDNGDFSDLFTGWTVSSIGSWIVNSIPSSDSMGALHIANNTSSISYPVEMNIGEYYFVTYTLVDPAGGPFSGGLSVGAGSSLVAGEKITHTVAGTYTDLVRPLATDRPDLLVDLKFTPDNGGLFDGYVTDISAQRAVTWRTNTIISAELWFYFLARDKRVDPTSADANFSITAEILKMSRDSSLSVIFETEATTSVGYPALDASFTSSTYNEYATEDSTNLGALHVATITPSAPIEPTKNDRLFLRVKFNTGTSDSKLERRFLGAGFLINYEAENL